MMLRRVDVERSGLPWIYCDLLRYDNTILQVLFVWSSCPVACNCKEWGTLMFFCDYQGGGLVMLVLEFGIVKFGS